MCGPLIRAQSARLAGVDLSSQMIECARTRGCYDEVVVAELSFFMRYREGEFDAVVSADTLVYFGALDEPLSAAREALRPNGTLIFTLELLRTASSGNFRLEAHGRYAHSEQYTRDALVAAGFSVLAYSEAALREERGAPVGGAVIAARRG